MADIHFHHAGEGKREESPPSRPAGLGNGDGEQQKLHNIICGKIYEPDARFAYIHII